MLAVVLLLGARLGAAEDAPAPENVPRSPEYHSLCFRGCDRSRCGSFLLIETGFLVVTNPSRSYEREQKAIITANLGWMKNVGDSSAVGVSFYAEGADDYDRLGIRLRYRRWLGRRDAFDINPGIAFSGATGDRVTFQRPAFNLQAALSLRDLVGLVVEVQWERRTYTDPFPAVPETSRSMLRYRAGLRAASYGSALLLGLFVALLISG